MTVPPSFLVKQQLAIFSKSQILWKFSDMSEIFSWAMMEIWLPFWQAWPVESVCCRFDRHGQSRVSLWTSQVSQAKPGYKFDLSVIRLKMREDSCTGLELGVVLQGKSEQVWSGILQLFQQQAVRGQLWCMVLAGVVCWKRNQKVIYYRHNCLK